MVICARRSVTCWRAQYTSVASSNTMVTSESPKRLKLRCSMIPGTLRVACSMGKVIRRSMSPAPSAGLTVITCTWLLVMSGTASIGSWVTL